MALPFFCMSNTYAQVLLQQCSGLQRSVGLCKFNRQILPLFALAQVLLSLTKEIIYNIMQE